MKKCNYCKVNILDDTCSCPLCNGVLEEISPSSNSYPNVYKKTRKTSIIFRILLFAGIVSVIVSLMLNYYMNFSYKPSLVITVSFVYALYIVYLFNREGAGYRRRILGGVIGGVLLITFIDYLFDFKKWSVDYVLPSAILAIELCFLILMIVNKRNWQSYIIVLGGTFLVSLVPLYLCRIDVIDNPIMSQIACAICLIVLLGVLILGGPRVGQELRRRFYIK